MSHIEFTRTTPDGQELFYQGWTPQGELKGVVCLVHGLGEHVGRYEHVGRALNEAGYVLLGFDQRGHGKTPGAKGVVPKFDITLDDITRLLDEATARFPAKPRFLYGHSMGGCWVLHYAISRRPGVAGIIATSPLLRTAFKPPAITLTLGKVLNRIAPNAVLSNGLDTSAMSRDPEVVRAYEADPLVHDKMSARLGIDLLERGEWALQHAAEFPSLPLLLVHGTGDRITSAPATEEFASRVRAAGHSDCTLKVWPGCYHETHNEPEKAQVIQYMIDWINAKTPLPQ